MSQSSRSSPINEANQIVTNMLIQSFIEEVTLFYEIVDHGDQFIFMKDFKIRGVLDTERNKSPDRLIEVFCELFTHSNNILINAEVIDKYDVPTLKLTLQDGTHFLVQDFSNFYKKL